MDFISRLYHQWRELTQAMTTGQRATLALVPLMLLAGFGWLLWQQWGTVHYTALSYGKVFTTEELIAAEQALIQEGLRDFRREGQRILVPASQVDRYNAALMQNDALPDDLGSLLLKQYESLGPFNTEKERQERREALVLQEVRRVLRAVPELENAHVAVASSGRRGWTQKPRVTATVSVRPRAGRELSPRLVHSIRAAVANMIPDLQPVDVTVFDVLHGISYSGESEQDPLSSKLVQRIEDFRRQYERQIEQALSYIPDAGVTVHVDLDNVKSSITRQQKIDPKTVPLVTQEMKIKDTLQQHLPRGEPGQVANRPAALSTSSSLERTRQFTDESSATVNAATFEVSEKELLAAMPRAVQVSVTIPRDYYRSVAELRSRDKNADPAQLDLTTIEKEVLANVTKTVRALIPADSPATAVTVNTVDRVPTHVPTLEPGWWDLLENWLQRWGGSTVLVLLAAWALWTLRRSLPTPSTEPPFMLPVPGGNLSTTMPSGAGTQPGSVATSDNTSSRPLTKRDALQTLVRDNPEATATVISKWLQSAH
ncbi:MAG: hypothetical protein KatS3mg114_0382 [Planctomycetaceae bacterium]|nr:MAG: hypothetical protein KatS3mg114_0382 [Planctomycetaceae bacterium]